MNCLCGSRFEYENCCQLLHYGRQQAVSAEALMRSRFTAYAMRLGDYLLATWDSHKRPKQIDFSKENNIKWIKLTVVNCKKGGQHDLKGIVEFKAYYQQAGEIYVMHEISRFTKKAGQWFYLDGLVKSVGIEGKPVSQGKNALCSCGSGKKFKRCCGKS